MAYRLPLYGHVAAVKELLSIYRDLGCNEYLQTVTASGSLALDLNGLNSSLTLTGGVFLIT